MALKNGTRARRANGELIKTLHSTTFKVHDQHEPGKFILICFLEGVYRLKGGLFDNRMRTLLFLLKGSWSWTQEGHIWSMGLLHTESAPDMRDFIWVAPGAREVRSTGSIDILLICECQTWMDVSGGNRALQDKKYRIFAEKLPIVNTTLSNSRHAMKCFP